MDSTAAEPYGKLSADVVFQLYNQAISVLNPLLGPQSVTQSYQSTTNSINTNPITGVNLINTNNTVYGIVTDNKAIMGAVKYTLDPFKFFGGYEFIWQNNPTDPLGVGASDQGGYIMSGVEDNNLDSEKLVQVWWTGVKYAYDSKTDITFAWYGQSQNTFRVPSTCSIAAGFRSSCAGVLDLGSLYVDHHFAKRFDAFAGLAYSFVTGGLAIAIPHGPWRPLSPQQQLCSDTRWAFQLLILQNPGKYIVVDVAASRYQAYAFSPDKLLLFERGGQAGRACSLHHVVRVCKVEPHGHTNFFLTHAHDVVYIAQYHFKRGIVGHTASHSVGKERGHRSCDLASCLERERISGRALGHNTHNFRFQV